MTVSGRSKGGSRNDILDEKKKKKRRTRFSTNTSSLMEDCAINE
jgi:hypothetical protein